MANDTLFISFLMLNYGLTHVSKGTLDVKCCPIRYYILFITVYGLTKAQIN